MAGQPVNSSWAQRLEQPKGFNKEEELLCVLQETNHRAHGLVKTSWCKTGAKNILCEQKSVHRSHCKDQCVTCFQSGVFQTSNFSKNTDFCLKGKVSILLWRTKQTDWWSKAFCQIYNTKWCRRRTLTSFVRHLSDAQLALFCFVKVLLFPSALTQAEKCIDLFRSNSWTFQSAAEVGEQNCFSL